jgi:hypothetical protein
MKFVSEQKFQSEQKFKKLPKVGGPAQRGRAYLI